MNGFDVSAVEGIKWSGTVAHFTDPAAPAGATFTANIDWGDNRVGTGNVVRTGDHEYDVNADGSRFLVNRMISPPDAGMSIIVDWIPPK